MNEREYLEALVTLYPTAAGGRTSAIAPRDGNYMPTVAFSGSGRRMQVKVIEGPATLFPGDEAVVVMQFDPPVPAAQLAVLEADLTLYEHDRAVGIGHLLRLW